MRPTDVRNGRAWISAIVVLGFATIGFGQCSIAKLGASDASPGDNFGMSVDVTGDRAVVGAFGGVGTCNDAGAAYVFGLEQGLWTEESQLCASDGDVGDWFGFSSAILGDRCIVGAPNHEGFPGCRDLNFQFIPGSPPAPDPFGFCGADPMDDALGCNEYGCP